MQTATETAEASPGRGRPRVAGSPSSPGRGGLDPADTLILECGLLDCGEHTPGVLSRPVCGDLLQQPQETNAPASLFLLESTPPAPPHPNHSCLNHS